MCNITAKYSGLELVMARLLLTGQGKGATDQGNADIAAQFQAAGR